jgi:hypothetical protein
MKGKLLMPMDWCSAYEPLSSFRQQNLERILYRKIAAIKLREVPFCHSRFAQTFGLRNVQLKFLFNLNTKQKHP